MADIARLDRSDRMNLLIEHAAFMSGRLLNLSELGSASGLDAKTIDRWHYRDEDQAEVDFVLERAPGKIVGIEIKASAAVMQQDFKGLSRLRDATGRGFVAGVLLHDGEQILPFGDRLIAAPFSVLWRNERPRKGDVGEVVWIRNSSINCPTSATA